MNNTPAINFDVMKRWNDSVSFTAKIACASGAPRSFKLRLAVLWARKNNKDLRGADLRGANLSGANLRDADLRDAILSDAILSDADWIPTIPNIHQAILAAASPKGALDMSRWHKDGYISKAPFGDAAARIAW